MTIEERVAEALEDLAGFADAVLARGLTVTPKRRGAGFHIELAPETSEDEPGEGRIGRSW